MWHEILGALALLAMVIFCVVVIPATPKLVDAVCDRIRYGVQDLVDSDVDEQSPPSATPTAAPTKPVAKPVPPARNAASAATPTAAATPTTKAAA